MEEIINLLDNESMRNRAMASVAESIFREDYLKNAALFEMAARFIENNQDAWGSFSS